MHLAIVRRGHFSTFDMLARGFAGDQHVRVIWDRRTSDRRRGAGVAGVERRGGDRRARSNPAWNGSDYLLLAVTPDTTTRKSSASSPVLEPLIAGLGLQADVDCAVRFDLPLMLTGGTEETRQQLAEYVHDRSARCRGPFVLFAASTDAGGRAVRWHAHIAARDALIAIGEDIAESLAMARFGTLFIPDVAATSPEQQAALVQFFQQRASCRGEIGADARVVTATSTDLFNEVAANRFSDDLFYYMNLLHLSIPVAAAV